MIFREKIRGIKVQYYLGLVTDEQGRAYPIYSEEKFEDVGEVKVFPDWLLIETKYSHIILTTKRIRKIEVLKA